MGTLVFSIHPPTGYPFRVVVDDQHSDSVSQSLAKGESWLNDEWYLLKLFMPKGARILDLGAHVGSFSLAAAAMGCEVLAVEASPSNAELIRASIRENRFSNYQLANVAVGAERGEIHFLSIGPYGHIVHQPQPGSQAVPIVPPDEILREHGWDTVDFIKMDIEGAEVQALQGMRKLLSSPDAPPIYYESNGYTLHEVGGTTCQKLKHQLEELGYKNFRYNDGNLIPVSASECQPQIVTDYLALKPEWIKKITTARSTQPIWRSALRRTHKACRRVVNAIRRRLKVALKGSIRPHKLCDLKFQGPQTNAELLREFLNLPWKEDSIVQSHLLRELPLAPLEIQNHAVFRAILSQSSLQVIGRAA